MTTSKERQINQLKKELDSAILIDVSLLADEIRSIGFKCKRCAQCCMEEYGDNTVSIFPSEIGRICQKTELELKDIVIPTPSDDRDSKGNIHTFEWVLRKNSNCIFLTGGFCKIYESRPHICKTYPFYLLERHLMVSDCSGIGADISNTESLELAKLLKERYIIEIKEAIALLDKFNGFNPGGSGNVCVHDSEGEHWISVGEKELRKQYNIYHCI